MLHDDVCAARSSCSASSTDRPRPAASRAMPAPLMPPPMTSEIVIGGGGRRHGEGRGRGAHCSAADCGSPLCGVHDRALRVAVDAPTHAEHHEHRPRNRRARPRHARLAPSPPRASRDRVRGNADERVRRRQAARRSGSRCTRGIAKTGVVGVLRNGVRQRRDRPARRPRCAAHPREDRASRMRRATRARCTRAATTATRRCCSARPRRMAQRQEFRRHRLFHLPAGRGERRRRPRDGARKVCSTGSR